MKKLLIAILLVVSSQAAFSQTIFFKGEWSMTDKKDLFTCYCKLNIFPAAGATVEFIWTYLATDSNNLELVNYYKGKKGKMGIEFTAGTYTVSTQDIFLSTTELADPQEILGKGKYFLKISLDKQVLYGRTTSMEGTDPGLFYAIRTNMASAEFEKLKEQVK